jgi:hypothetical protein
MRLGGRSGESGFHGLVEFARADAQAAVGARRGEHETVTIDGERQDPAFVVVHMAADQIHPAGSAKNARLCPESAAEFLAKWIERSHGSGRRPCGK